MSDDSIDRISKESLKAAEDFVNKMKQAKDSTKAINDAFGAISTQLLGISGSMFFKEVKKTTEEIRKQKKEVSKLKDNLGQAYKDIGEELQEQFKDAISYLEEGPAKFDTSALGDMAKTYGIDTFTDINDLQKQINKKFTEGSKEHTEFEEKRKEFIKEEKDYYKNNEEFYREALKVHPKLLADLSEQERIQAFQKIHQQGFNHLINTTDSLVLQVAKHSKDVAAGVMESAVKTEELNDKLGETIKELESANKLQFDLGAGIAAMAKNLGGDILKSVIDFDKAISDAGRDFGFVNAKSLETSVHMASLGQSAARFNVSMGDALKMAGGLGDELATINEVYLVDSVNHFMAIQKATGISADETNKIAGEMMRAGSSAEDVELAMEAANKTSKMFGVNTKKVLQGVAKNLEKMRHMGFQGGVESLTKMVAEAERLRLNFDEIFDMGKRARTIEGAMEMAAELQLAGGSFSQINPMDLLSASRKGPQELQNILKTMGKDIGKFSEETGEFTFDPVDVDRLQIMADATGVSLDSMQKMIQKNAEDAKKAEFMPDLQLGEVMGPDGKPLDQDMMNNMLKDSVDINGDIMEGSLLAEAGVDNLADLTSEQATQILEDYQNKQKTLAEQAEANQSLMDSISAFKDAILNMFVILEPLIKIFTWLIQTFNAAPGWVKILVAGLIAFVAFGPKLAGMLGGFTKSIGGIGERFKAMMSGSGIKEKVKGALGYKPKVDGGDSKDKTPGKNEGGLSSLAKGLAKMGGKGVLKGIGNTALAGPALALMLPGMPTLGLMIAIGAGGALLEAGFKALSSGIASFGNKKNIWKGIAAIAVAGPALVVFSAALLPLALMIPIGLGGILIVAAFQALSTGLSILGNNFSSVAKGAIALILVGASLIPFAIAAQIMTGVDWLSVLAGVGVLALVVLGLMGLGALLMGPQILFLLLGVATLIMVGAALLIASVGLMAAGAAFQMLAEVNWEGISGMGSALMSSVPGLIAFSLASMMFLNPLTLLGMFAMIGTLGALALVMIPLGASLVMAADGMDRFASGLTKLQAAANSLDLEKLEMLKDLSWSMAMAAMAGMMGGGLGYQIQKIAEALAALTKSSGGGGGGGTKKIEINLKMNGRDIQNIIVDDTSIVS